MASIFQQLIEGQKAVSTGITMELIICYKCSIPFAVAATFKQHLQESHETFHCPHGHQQIYCKSTKDVLKEQNEKLQRDLLEKNNVIAAKQSEINNLEYLSTSLERQKVRLNNKLKRVKNGVCPCCNRTFQNLLEHMKSKHPEEVKKAKI